MCPNFPIIIPITVAETTTDLIPANVQIGAVSGDKVVFGQQLTLVSTSNKTHTVLHTTALLNPGTIEIEGISVANAVHAAGDKLS